MASTTTPGIRADLLTGLDDELGVMVRRIRRVIRENAAAVHPELQPAGYLLLSWLANNGPQRGSAVSDQLGIDKGAISRQAQHLEDLGLIDRSADPDDGRAMLLAASAAALEALDRVRDDRRASVGERLADWSDGDLTALVSLLGRYNAALELR